jgi:hypothetical protein
LSHFVVIFDRRHPGKPAKVERFEDAAAARARLFEAESELRADDARGGGDRLLETAQG